VTRLSIKAGFLSWHALLQSSVCEVLEYLCLLEQELQAMLLLVGLQVNV
jgi:hypothetical protein